MKDRLGCTSGRHGGEEIRKHQYFKTVNWKRLSARLEQPPFVPDVSIADFPCTCPAYLKLDNRDILSRDKMLYEMKMKSLISSAIVSYLKQ